MADDDANERKLAEIAFQAIDAGNDLRFVRDGAELLDYLHQRGPYADPELAPWPSLILLDLHMPRLDGHQALRAIKGDARLRRIPVIVLTNSREHRDLVSAYQVGVNAFIVKPFRFGELVQVLAGVQRYWLAVAELPPPPA